MVMETTENKQIGILRTDVSPSLQYWLAAAHRRKAIFHTITKFRPALENQPTSTSERKDNSIFLVVEGWMLSEAATDVIVDLRRLSDGIGGLLVFNNCSLHCFFFSHVFIFLPLLLSLLLKQSTEILCPCL